MNRIKALELTGAYAKDKTKVMVKETAFVKELYERGYAIVSPGELDRIQGLAERCRAYSLTDLIEDSRG